MKSTLFLLLALSGLSMSCEQEGIMVPGTIGEGFTIVSGGQQVLGPDDIDFYDFSAHLIYLKDHKTFSADFAELGDFTVMANGEEVYSGQTLPGYSSYLPLDKVIIRIAPSFYGDYLVPLSYLALIDERGQVSDDPRDDDRIVTALKQHDQFYAGLGCSIQAVQRDASGQVCVSLLLSNPDDRNYYYLDPDKMGIRLFHYFTNGLYLGPPLEPNKYSNQLMPEQLESPSTWKSEWLSLLKAHESKEITLVYPDFEPLPPGQYRASFQFPGLGRGVDSDELVQADGRIWLGNLSMVKEDVLIR